MYPSSSTSASTTAGHEAGPQLGLIFKPSDIFNLSDYDGDLTYKRNTKDEYTKLDAGLYGGIGYKFKKRPNISGGIITM